MTFDRDVCTDFARSSSLEWLEANGLGGWAASTISGAHTRRYHGLLVAATEPPVGRKVLLSRLDETIDANGQIFDLGANRFPGAIHPRGFEHLVRFHQELFPTWEYEIGTARLTKTIAAVHLESDENATLVLYELSEGNAPIRLTLRPFYAGRDFHSLGHANDFVHTEGTFEEGTLRYQSYDGLPAVYLHVPGGDYAPSPDWWRRFEYDLERERGLDFEEDLFTPGAITVSLAPGARLGVLISTAPPSGRDAWDLFAAERERREKLLAPFADSDPCTRALALAADAFIVRRGRPGAGLSTVIAGYPWFSDWGRDSMIALPGLCLTTGRFAEAKGILRAFGRAASQGLLPNRFSDAADEAPEYNTVFGEEERAADLRHRAERVRERFVERFWNEEAGGLYDVVNEEGNDASVRPNQIFALSLPFPLLEGDRAARLLALVEAKLLTPRGLRTLSADDPRYRPIYIGGPLERDGAYHQGTVWPWLLGPYLTALVRFRGESGKHQGRKILEEFAPHLAEAGIGTVSEIFDAEPPHAPRGCPAQAWSVAELLRAAVELAS